VDGPFTGKGYSLGIIDDPYKGPGDAASPALRQKLIDWLRSVWLTRAEPASVLGPDGREHPNLSAQVVVLTRWDHQDVIGWLLEQELSEAPQHWTVLDLPAIADDPAERPKLPPTCTLIPDWRQAGEALCPERFPLPELLKIRARLGAYWWAALYQQRPSPASGSIFLRQWIRPPFPREDGSQRQYALLALSCDLSFKGEAESDYCGFCLVGLLAPPARNAIPRSGKPQGHQNPQALEIEVLWAARHRFGLPEVIRFLLGCLQALEQQCLRPNAVLIEDAANGPAVLQTLRRRVPGMLPITARGSKETRAHAVAPLVEAGQIRFHHRAQPLVEEAIRFPKGSKDLVDAFCHGALWLEGRYWKAQGIQPVVTPLLVSR
jgi:predicted phage terminase large subunit-like protein